MFTPFRAATGGSGVAGPPPCPNFECKRRLPDPVPKRATAAHHVSIRPWARAPTTPAHLTMQQYQHIAALCRVHTRRVLRNNRARVVCGSRREVSPKRHWPRRCSRSAFSAFSRASSARADSWWRSVAAAGAPAAPAALGLAAFLAASSACCCLRASSCALRDAIAPPPPSAPPPHAQPSPAPPPPPPPPPPPSLPPLAAARHRFARALLSPRQPPL